jgi:hypothetical protein
MKIKLPFLLVFSLCLLVANTCYSQSKNIKQPLTIVKYGANVDAPLNSNELKQLQEVYGNKLEEHVLSKPQRLKDMKHLLRNRIEIKMISNPKYQKQSTLLSEVPLFDYYVKDLKRDESFSPNDFNPLKYLFNFYASESHMYRVDNTNYFIFIKSQHLQ